MQRAFLQLIFDGWIAKMPAELQAVDAGIAATSNDGPPSRA
jgi:hypothetical protein